MATNEALIVESYKRAEDKTRQINILADNCHMTYKQILDILTAHGCFGKKAEKSAMPPHQSRKRIVWTDDMLRQLTELRDKGEGVAQIAKVMGLDTQQVSNKLQRMPDQLTAVPVSPPKSPKPEPDKPVVVETSPESEPLPADLPQEFAENKEYKAAHASEPVPKPTAVPEPQPDNMQEQHDAIDMPTALFRMMRLVYDNFSVKVVRVHASNDEHRAACAFEVDGTDYDLTLEVIE